MFLFDIRGKYSVRTVMEPEGLSPRSLPKPPIVSPDCWKETQLPSFTATLVKWACLNCGKARIRLFAASFLLKHANRAPLLLFHFLCFPEHQNPQQAMGHTFSPKKHPAPKPPRRVTGREHWARWARR